jgi:hypothetical protein
MSTLAGILRSPFSDASGLSLSALFTGVKGDDRKLRAQVAKEKGSGEE